MLLSGRRQTPIISTLIILFVFTGLTTAGQKQNLKPVSVNKPVFFAKTSPLRQLPVVKPERSADDEGGEVENPGRFESNAHEIPGFVDPVLQKPGHENRSAEIIHNFEGVDNQQYVLPPDTEGDVGKDHYIQMVNMSFAVYDKSGNMLYGPASNLSVWQQAPEPWASHSNGDPIVLYDESADRWLLSELSFPTHPYSPHYIKIAISETSDPLGSWYLYGYEYDYFCDYPKISVWHDGYYLTANNNFWINNQWDFHAVGLSVFERDSLLAGSPNARRFFYDFYPNQQPWSMLPADFDGPVPVTETPAFLAYLDEGSTDRIFIYKVNTDWQNINNSSVQWEATLLPEPFSDNLPNGITQPENAPYLAPMANRLMYRLQFRHFDGYNAMVANHTVNRGDFVAGIRWYEFRDDGSGWAIHQQGTYSPDDTHRWMGSVAMDGYGNIAAGYSVSGHSVYPSIRIAGRTAQAEPGIFDVAEQTVIDGTGYQSNPNHRWGDYSAMMIDPTDQTTFWYTQQYYETTSDRDWQTRVAAFHITDYLEMDIIALENTVCLGNATQLIALLTGGSENYSFTWESNPPGFYSDEQNPVVSPTENTTYICDANDGVNQVADSVTIVVNLPPVAYAGPDTVICANHDFEITKAEAQHNEGVLWETTGDGTFSNAQLPEPTYSPGQNDIETGLATLTITAFPNEGCEAVSDSLILLIDPCTGISEMDTPKNVIDIYPNPGNGKLCLGFAHRLSEKVKFEIYDLNGVKKAGGIIQVDTEKRTVSLDLTNLSGGLYVLHIKSGRLNDAMRVIINR